MLRYAQRTSSKINELCQGCQCHEDGSFLTCWITMVTNVMNITCLWPDYVRIFGMSLTINRISLLINSIPDNTFLWDIDCRWRELIRGCKYKSAEFVIYFWFYFRWFPCILLVLTVNRAQINCSTDITFITDNVQLLKIFWVRVVQQQCWFLQ